MQNSLDLWNLNLSTKPNGLKWFAPVNHQRIMISSDGKLLLRHVACSNSIPNPLCKAHPEADSEKSQCRHRAPRDAQRGRKAERRSVKIPVPRLHKFRFAILRMRNLRNLQNSVRICLCRASSTNPMTRSPTRNRRSTPLPWTTMARRRRKAAML